MISVIIPTYNAMTHIQTLIKSLKQQTIDYELIIIDSSSTDGTQTMLQQLQVPYISIPNNTFNHGATRNYGVSLAKYDNLVFLTQDALPVRPDTLESLHKALMYNENIAIAYGRQLPYADADVLSQFARITNYPNQSILKSKADIPEMGIKTCHCSNSFAAYRKKDLISLGGFPSDTILGEDVTVAAQLILRGKYLSYSAEAEVYHSHNYTIVEEFKRYFDIGVFHKQQKTVLQQFTQAESEGIKYIISEWKYLISTNNLKLFPIQLSRTLIKYIGYKAGYYYQIFPTPVRKLLSMHSSFWI